MKLIWTLLIGVYTTAKAEISPCPQELKTYKDLIACAEKRSPEIQISEAELNKSKAEVKTAEQWQNPELSVGSLYGKTGGENNLQTDLALGFPLELGGKISSRKAVAQGNVTQAEARLVEIKSKVKSEVFLKLHRLRQVYHEQEIVDEAIETFTKLVNQIGKRSHLSPEQQVSSAVFRMSKSDYEIKRVEILEEIASLDAYFKISIGEEIAKIKSLLPLDIKSWPEFENDYKIGSSPKSKVVQAELDASRAGLSLAKSESWPTITLGPSVQIQNQGDQTSQMYGFNLSLPIPLFNSNNGERALANGGVVVSEVRKSSVVFEEKTRRAELLKVFNESKRALMSILSHKEMENQHAEMDALFAKGIVSSALIIEAHRTFIELEKTRHQREMKAIEAMVSLYVIDGKDWESLL